LVFQGFFIIPMPLAGTRFHFDADLDHADLSPTHLSYDCIQRCHASPIEPSNVVSSLGLLHLPMGQVRTICRCGSRRGERSPPFGMAWRSRMISANAASPGVPCRTR